MYQPPIKGKYLKKKIEQPKQDFSGSLDSVIKLTTDLYSLKTSIIDTVNTKIDEIDSLAQKTETTLSENKKVVETALSELENVAIEILNHVRTITQGVPGENADTEQIIKEVIGRIPKFDEEKITKNILSQIPKYEKIDIKAISKSVISQLPENKASLKIIQEKFEVDPMSVIDKIMSLPHDKFKLKTNNIDGLEQTISAFRNQLSRGYLHGGGISEVIHDSTLTGKGTVQSPLSVVTMSSGVTSLNALTGSLTIVSGTTGTDFGITSAGTIITLNLPIANATNTGKLSNTDWSTFNSKQGTITIGTFGSIPNNNGLSLSANVLTMQPADSTHPGGISTSNQTFAGIKTTTIWNASTQFNIATNFFGTQDTAKNSLFVGLGSNASAGATSNTILGLNNAANLTNATSNNVIIGDSIGGTMVSSNDNVLIGHGVGNGLFTGGQSAIIGSLAGQATTGNSCIFGYAAAQNSTGSVSAFGYSAGNSQIAQTNNSYFGNSTDISGSFNNSTALGYSAIITKSNQFVFGQTGTPVTNWKIASVDYAFPITQGGSATFLKNDGSGNLSWSTTVSGVTTIGTFGSTPNANGGSISGVTLTLQPADGSNPGGVSTTTQTFAGAKTFSSTPVFSTMTLGSVLFAGTSGILSQDNANFFYNATNHSLTLRSITSLGTGSSLYIASAAPVTANYGNFSMGAGAFDGTTSGFFVGSSAGTQFAINMASGATSDIANWQVAGTSQFKVTAGGTLSNAGQISLAGGGFTSASGTRFAFNTVSNFGGNNPNLSVSNTNTSVPTFVVAAGSGQTVPMVVFQDGTSGNSIHQWWGIRSATSGTLYSYRNQFSFAPTSGTAVLHAYALNTVINQTSTSTGDVMILRVNPTLTAYKSAATTNRLVSVAMGGTESFGIDFNGHTLLEAGAGTTSVAINTGTATLSTGASDHVGKVMANNTGASVITITFANAYLNAPSAFAYNETTPANVISVITTTTTLTITGVTVSGDKIAYGVMAS